MSMAVTEGRIVGYQKCKPRSSSCGDLLHCVAFAAGLRGDIVNRTEHRGWKPIANITRWWPRWTRVPGTGRIALPSLGMLLPGDFGMLDGDTPAAHVFVALSLNEARTELLSADFGQPGGALRRCPVVVMPSGQVKLRGRRWTHHLSLARLPWEAPPMTVGAWLEAHGLDPEPWFEPGQTANDICTEEEILRIDREGVGA
jgi:hypothetical protein